jgi:micrococcal nuclease
MYEYNAKVIRVVDGDTVELRVDMGFRCSMTISARLLGIDAPEMHKKAQLEMARKATAALAERLEGKDVRIVSKKADDWGRWLVLIWDTTSMKSINDWMIEQGYAVLSLL